MAEPKHLKVSVLQHLGPKQSGVEASRVEKRSVYRRLTTYYIHTYLRNAKGASPAHPVAQRPRASLGPRGHCQIRLHRGVSSSPFCSFIVQALARMPHSSSSSSSSSSSDSGSSKSSGRRKSDKGGREHTSDASDSSSSEDGESGRLRKRHRGKKKEPRHRAGGWKDDSTSSSSDNDSQESGVRPDPLELAKEEVRGPKQVSRITAAAVEHAPEERPVSGSSCA